MKEEINKITSKNKRLELWERMYQAKKEIEELKRKIKELKKEIKGLSQILKELENE